MILGTGLDIVDIRRFQRMYERHGDRLARHILADQEWDSYRAQKKPYRFLASRFAAKEAVVKAFGTGFGKGITPRTIATVSNTLGAPALSLTGGAADKAQQLGANRFHISLSDEASYVVAMVVIEKTSGV